MFKVPSLRNTAITPLYLRRIGSDFARSRAYHGAKATGKKLEMRTCRDIVGFLQSSTGTLPNSFSSLPVLRVQG